MWFLFIIYFLSGKDEKKSEEAKEKYVIRDRLTRQDKYPLSKLRITEFCEVCIIGSKYLVIRFVNTIACNTVAILNKWNEKKTNIQNFIKKIRKTIHTLYTGLFFEPMLFSPLYTCQWFWLVLNSPRRSCTRRKIIL